MQVILVEGSLLYLAAASGLLDDLSVLKFALLGNGCMTWMGDAGPLDTEV
jgi:aconitase A